MSTNKYKIKKYMNLLAENQPDIRYIIASSRRSKHRLSVEEISSEVNLRMAKSAERFISNNQECLTKDGFKKILCRVCNNCVRWTCYGVSYRDRAEYGKKVDNSQINEDGDSILSLVLNTSSFQNFKDSKIAEKSALKISNLLKWIEDYSDFLTNNELSVFKNLRKGVSKKEIAQNMKVSHQMISLYEQSIFEKIQSNIKASFCIYSESKKIKSSQDSINRLFCKK
jgi:DNA-binding CsgD family transcriptional regulator